ncbi:MarR family winged helix-turn-helix transcriptional regulator [Desertihabitans aurantiacus]|uniref:MarR family winged helix-turn-helix transcriptional regulator n=1 Tax=Desertihabitans aurantiacus TaxID=2282477 RepID=UPI000DF82639|nr:MarR family transcriptional regulator [Desertihabitans aurantiacus]
MTAQRPDLLDLEVQVCFGLVAASRRVVALYRPLLEPMGLTHPLYLLMLALWQHGRLPLHRLAELVHQDPATVSPMVKKLESLGYVSRRRDPADERALSIELTDRGRELRRSAEAIPVTMMERLGLGEDELARLRVVLDDLIDRSLTVPD